MGTRRWSAAAGVLVVLAAGSVALAATRDDAPSEDRLWGNTTRAAPTGSWKRVADAPLSPRSDAEVVWTGDEVLVIGGDENPPCPPSADCTAGAPPLRDGAAYDPATDTWRPIADPPQPLTWGNEVAVVDGVVYLRILDEADRIFRYHVAEDRWDEMEAPPMMAARTLVADGDRLLAPLQLTRGVGTEHADLAYDPAADEWTALPLDPYRDDEARQILPFDDRLYLVSGSNAPGSDGIDPIVHAAVLDDGTWRRLPAPNTDGYFPGLATRDLLVSPLDDETAGDGDDVPGWWAFDPTVDEWVDVPEVPSAPGPQVADWEAGDHHLFSGDVVLDTRTRRWAPLGAPDELDRQGTQSTAMGDRVLVFGGATVDGDDFAAYADAELQHDAWIWTPDA
ncbi:MAG: hypothetical protein JWO77_615 [Ilumatobacteraceae bacterium]|nr:hypothetical protein [Ilumatobacteraceae bacterium]